MTLVSIIFTLYLYLNANLFVSGLFTLSPRSHLYWYSDSRRGLLYSIQRRSVVGDSYLLPVFNMSCTTVSNLFNLVHYTNKILSSALSSAVIDPLWSPASAVASGLNSCLYWYSENFAFPTPCQVCCPYVQVELHLTSPVALFTFLFNEQFYTSNHSDFPSSLPVWSSPLLSISPRSRLYWYTESRCCGPLYLIQGPVVSETPF